MRVGEGAARAAFAVAAAIAIACAAAPSPPGGALREVDPSADLSAVIQEVTKVDPTAGSGMRYVAWMPVEVFVAIGVAQGVPREQVQQNLAGLAPYLMVIAADLSEGMNQPGRSRLMVESHLSLIADGAVHHPISEDALDPGLRTLLDGLAPMWRTALGGNVGDSMYAFLFPRVVDPLVPGVLSIRLFESDFVWRLPVGSLVLPRRCPVDGEKLNGAWAYCPHHGVPLE